MIENKEEYKKNWKELMSKQQELSEKLRTGDYTTDYYPMEKKDDRS